MLPNSLHLIKKRGGSSLKKGENFINVALVFRRMARTVEFNINSLITLINMISGITSIKNIIRCNKLLSKVDETVDALTKPKCSIRLKQPQRRTFILTASFIIFIVLLCGRFTSFGVIVFDCLIFSLIFIQSLSLQHQRFAIITK